MIFIKVSIISVGDNIYIYGIRSISAYLKKYGHDIQLIFLPSYQKKYPKEILRDLRNLVKESNLIGISCTSYTSDKAIQVIKYLKSLKIPAIWGGIHATFNPEECIKYADIVCIGEGEETMLELVEKLSKKENITTIRNLWVKKNGRIYKNDVRPLIQDLDKLPHADYDFENQWVLDNGKIVNMSEKHLGEGEFNQYVPFKVRKFLPEFRFSRLMLVHTTRGCPHSCTFCCNYNLKKIYLKKGNYIRKRSIRNVIEEVVNLKQKFPSIDFVWFTDDTFLIRSGEEIALFCKEYKKKVGLPFMCYVDPLTFDETKLRLLINAGLKRIEMGIQTGSEKINKNLYNRFVTNERLIAVTKIINKYSHKMVPPEYQIIVANPYETEKDVLSTIDLIQKLPKPYFLQTFALVFFPGTQLFYKARNDGIIKSKKDACYDLHYMAYKENLMNKFKKLDAIYLNSILMLMCGRVTSSRYGRLPKPVLKLLLNKMIVRFFNKFQFLIKLLIRLSYIFNLKI